MTGSGQALEDGTGGWGRSIVEKARGRTKQRGWGKGGTVVPARPDGGRSQAGRGCFAGPPLEDRESQCRLLQSDGIQHMGQENAPVIVGRTGEGGQRDSGSSVQRIM